VVAALLVMLLTVAVFASQNVQQVDVNLLVWDFSWPLGVIVIAATAAGAVLVALFGLVRQVGLTLRVRDVSGRLRRTETELARTKEELEKATAQVKEKEQDLVATRAQLAAASKELEEAYRRLSRLEKEGQTREGGVTDDSEPARE